MSSQMITRKRSAELDGLIKKLYESYATGKITESRFDTLIAEYEKEHTEKGRSKAVAS